MGSYFSYAEKIEDSKIETLDHFENFLKILKNVDVGKLSMKQRKILEDVELSLLTGDLSQSIEECEDVEKMRELIFEQRKTFASVLECFMALLLNVVEREDDLSEVVEEKGFDSLEVVGTIEYYLEKLFKDVEIRNSILDEWKKCFEKDSDWLQIILQEYTFLLSSELFADRPKRVMNRVIYWETNLFQKIHNEDLRRRFREERSGFILRCTDKKDAEKVISRTFAKILEMEEEHKMNMARGNLQNELREALQKRLETPVKSQKPPNLKTWTSESCDESSESFDDFQISRTKSAAKPIPISKHKKPSFSYSLSEENSSSVEVPVESSVNFATVDASETSETVETEDDSTSSETIEDSETSESIDTKETVDDSTSSETSDDSCETPVDSENTPEIPETDTTDSSSDSTPLFVPQVIATNSSEDSDDTSELSFLQSNSSREE